MRLYSYGAARMSLEVDRNAVGRFQYAGPITPAVLVQSWIDTSEFMLQTPLRAGVFRMDTAVVAFDLGTLRGLTHVFDPKLWSVPFGGVYTPDHLEMANRHCEIMATRGLIRRIFTSYAPALDWATRKGLALVPALPSASDFQATR